MPEDLKEIATGSDPLSFTGLPLGLPTVLGLVLLAIVTGLHVSRRGASPRMALILGGGAAVMLLGAAYLLQSRSPYGYWLALGLIFGGIYLFGGLRRGRAMYRQTSLWQAVYGNRDREEDNPQEQREARRRVQGEPWSLASDFIHLTYDRRTKQLDGRVLRGAWSGASLNQMSFGDKQRLLTSLQIIDPQSVGLMEGYLDRTEPAGWRQRAAGDAGAERSAAQAEAPAKPGTMNRSEAVALLGLKEPFTPADVRLAHRRLIAKVHPDAGGSGWLTAKVNEAKDRLLK